MLSEPAYQISKVKAKGIVEIEEEMLEEFIINVPCILPVRHIQVSYDKELNEKHVYFDGPVAVDKMGNSTPYIC